MHFVEKEPSQKRIDLNEKLNSKSSDLNIPHDLIQQRKLLSLDDEDQEFIDDYNRVIDSDLVKHVEDLRIGEDNFIGMELGIRRGDDAMLDRGVVKKRAIGNDGLPMGTHNKNISTFLLTLSKKIFPTGYMNQQNNNHK